jgi:hypothetical protein
MRSWHLHQHKRRVISHNDTDDDICQYWRPFDAKQPGSGCEQQTFQELDDDGSGLGVEDGREDLQKDSSKYQNLSLHSNEVHSAGTNDDMYNSHSQNHHRGRKTFLL